MTTEDRVKVVAEFGFTSRQARFLVMVMRYAGVCLLRQYSTSAGIVHGQKTRAFFSEARQPSVRVRVPLPDTIADASIMSITTGCTGPSVSPIAPIVDR